MARTVIYGGTFNPMHRGHVELIRFLLSTGEYDRLRLIPSASPPHKDAPQLADAEDRVAMCRLATAELPTVELVDWEIARGGKSYTVDTVEHLRQQYPNDSFYLLIGTDMFLTFCQWRSWETLGSWVTLLVASRENDDLASLEQQKSELEKLGVSSHIIRNPVIEASSTQVRQQLAQNGYSRLLQPAVEQYCKAHKLYGIKYELQQLRNIIKPLLKPDRYHHSICVEQRAVELAVRYGANENKAAAAAILHDICKNMSQDSLLQMVQSCDTITSIDFVGQPQLLHSHAGAIYLERELGIADHDLLNAVRYHTTARKNMSLLEQIVYLADLTSNERDYPDVDDLRALCDVSINKAMAYALSYIANEHLPRVGVTPCQDTQEALAEYEAEIN